MICKMTRIIFVLLATLTVLFTPSFILAQNNSTNSSSRKATTKQIIEERKLRLAQRKEELGQVIAERKATNSARLEAHRKLKIENLFNMVRRRLLATIERLELLIERIESRLAKIEAEEEAVETADIHTDLALAKDILLGSKSSLQEAERKLALALESEDPQGGYLEVKTLIKGVVGDLMEVKKILAHLIGNIRGLRVGNTPSRVPSITGVPTITIAVTPTPTIVVTPILTSTPTITP